MQNSTSHIGLPFAAEHFTDPAAAVERVHEIYEANTAYLRDCFKRFSAGENIPQRVHACYPFVRVHTEIGTRVDTRLSYGFVAGPGTYATTVTRPDLFSHYFLEQFELLRRNHGVVLEVGVSRQPIPIHFAFPEGLHVEGDLTPQRLALLRDSFDLPDLSQMDDSIVNGTHIQALDEPTPLALFTGPRVDYSLHRLKHYTATSPDHFQNFVLFTNYQFYIDEFIRLGMEIMSPTDDPEQQEYRKQYTAFIEPGDFVIPNQNLGGADTTGARLVRLPQMPAYHLKRADGVRHHDGQYRRRPQQCQDDHRPHRRPSPPRLDHARPLRRTAQHPAARRLRPRPRLCPRGPRSGRRPAALGPRPPSGRGPSGAGRTPSDRSPA